ncbi:hypothetical protein N665_0178s0018 [Sinapis alba]|nr:hypothetical protein N665_0178s0018 [Sinapis alba]
MVQEDYNIDMNTEVVELTYSLLEAMMQHMAPDTPYIHVISDRQVQNLLKITKTHEVRLCVSSLIRTVNDGSKEAEDANDVSDEVEEEEDEGDEDEGDEDDDNLAEDENYEGENDDGEEDVDIHDAAKADDNDEDYSEYEKVNDKDEEEEDDMCFQDFKATRHMVRSSAKHKTNTFWVAQYVEAHTCFMSDQLAQRKHCTPNDRQVQNLLKITKTHEVRLCVSSLIRTVNDGSKEAEDANDVSDEVEEEEDEGDEDEGDEDDDNLAEDENYEGENDDGEEDVDIHDAAKADDNDEDYSEYEKVNDKDEEEEDDMCFQDFKATRHMVVKEEAKMLTISMSTRFLLVGMHWLRVAVDSGEA